MAVKVGFVSLGCPKNLINTEVMLAKLAAEGFEIVAEDVDADVIVINTCAFIESAKQEAIDNILDVAWLKENHTLRGIVVTGCLPERYREQLLEEMPEVDCILGTGSYGDICEAVRSAYAKKPARALRRRQRRAARRGARRHHAGAFRVSANCGGLRQPLLLLRDPVHPRPLPLAADGRNRGGGAGACGARRAGAVPRRAGHHALRRGPVRHIRARRAAARAVGRRPGFAGCGCSTAIPGASPTDLSKKSQATPRWSNTSICPSSIFPTACCAR